MQTPEAPTNARPSPELRDEQHERRIDTVEP